MAATAPADDKVDPKVIKTGLILVVGILAVVFDTTIVSVALHTLVTQLHSSVSTHPVGQHRLPAGPGHDGAAVHLGVAAVRREAAVDVRAHRLPRRLHRVEPGLERRLPDRLASRPGGRRRAAAIGPDDAHHAGRRGQVARPDGHPHRAARADGPDPRPAHRGRDPDPPELAVHVLGERAVLPHRPRSGREVPAQGHRRRGQAEAGHPRVRAPRARHRGAHPRPVQRGRGGRVRPRGRDHPAGDRRRPA